MPPRFAYWTILIDDSPTAFRARDRAELAGILRQLASRNANVVMKWFSNGRLWESPEEAQAARRAQRAETAPRGADWRPGGRHEDPRARFERGRRQSRRQDPRVEETKQQGENRTAKPAPRDRDRRTAGPPGERERRPPKRFDRRDGRDRSPHGGGPPGDRQGSSKWPGDRSGKPPGERRGKPFGDRPGKSFADRRARGAGKPGGRERDKARGDRASAKPWQRQEGSKQRDEHARRPGRASVPTDQPVEPEVQPPPPPGPERPPKPGHEPGPDVPSPETIRILPEPPERAAAPPADNTGGRLIRKRR